MAVAGDTGNGATLTFGTTALSFAIMTISPGKETVAPVDASVLATTDHMEKLPGDLRDSGECTATFKWVPTLAAPDLPTVAETITITWPAYGALTTAAVYTGTGFITGWKATDFANGELQVGEVNWVWNGDTGPAYTVAS